MTEMTGVFQIALGLIIIALVLGSAILFFLQQQRLLEHIRPENRLLPPGKVWLQMIPLYGIVYQFIVVGRIADSIARELSSEDENNWLINTENTIGARPTYKLGLTCGILWCCTAIRLPILETLITIAAFGFWIAYWVELRRYYAILKQRTIPLN